MQRDRDGEALDSRAWLVAERLVWPHRSAIRMQSGCNLNLIRNKSAIHLWMHRIQIWKRCFHLCSFFVLKLDWPEVWFYCNSSFADSWATVCLVKWQIKSKKRLRSTYFRERCGKIWCRELLFVVTFVQMLWWQQAGCSFLCASAALHKSKSQ